MSGPALNETLTIGWYGKLPSAGDFVSRRLPRRLLDVLDDWLRRGVTELRAAMPDHWRDVYAAAPAWNCAVPGSLISGTTFIGVIAPSRDRVGREFPICAGIAVTDDRAVRALLADSHGWLWSLGQCVVDARDRHLPLELFDACVQDIALPSVEPEHAGNDGAADILSVLGSGADVTTLPMPLAQALPWPELPIMFDADAGTSFWWTNAGAGAPLRGFTTDGGLSGSLMVTLMRPLGALRRKHS